MGAALLVCVGLAWVCAMVVRRAVGERKELGGPLLPDVCRLTSTLLTPAEQRFIEVLLVAVPGGVAVCPKVRVGDVVDVKPGANSQGVRNRVNRNHFDFVLVDRGTWRVLGAVELDDASHLGALAKERDTMKDEVAVMVGLRLVRVRASARYDVGEVRESLARIIFGST